MDLDVFDENPLEYHNFITLFYELVEKRIDDPRGRLTRRVTHRIVCSNHHQLVIKMPIKFWSRTMEIVTTLWLFVGIMATNQKWIWRKLSDVLQFSLEM